MFDLYLYPFGIKNKQEYSKIPGFLISTAAKKTSRNRMDDILLLYYTNYEEMPSAEEDFLSQLLPETKDYYFKTAGPITTAIKKSAEFLNDQILQFNLKQLKRPNLVGALQIMVMHENEAYIMHAGETASFLLTRRGTEKFTDPAVGGQGIGVSRGLRYRFHHVSINTGDRIILVSKPPKTWTVNSMTGSTRLSISHLRRLLISEADQAFETVVMQFRPGDRSVHLLKLNIDSTEGQEQQIQPIEPTPDEKKSDRSGEQTFTRVYDPAKNLEEISSEPPSSEDIAKQSILESQKYKPEQTETIKKETSFENEPESAQEIDARKDAADVNGPKNLSGDSDFGGGFFISGKKLENLSAQKRNKRPGEAKFNRDRIISIVVRLRASVRSFSSGSKKMIGKVEKGITTLIDRSIPGEIGAKSTLTGSGMFFMALIVPIIVVAVAMTVYLQNKSEIHQEKILQARNQISLAVESENVPEKISYYQAASALLAEAETYGSSDALLDLRNIVQAQMDTFSGITRIDAQPSVAGGLVKKISITKMVTALSEDVYALDESTGHVIRMVASKPDFTIDNDFICGPGKHGEIIVSNLIDIEPVNVQNSQNITMMGIDENGSLLLCSTRGTPIAIRLKTPDLGWGSIQAITFDGYFLYILDNGDHTRDIYAYEADKLSFNVPGKTLFEQNIPGVLQTSIDMAKYQEDLYLLQENGMLSRCSIGVAGIETKCDINIGYGIIQPDQVRQIVPVLENTQLQQLFITQPPDPSIYFLDSEAQAVYHFSLALNMQKQIRPNLNSLLFKPDGSLSAATVSPSGIVHFAYGHQTYFGELP